MAEANLAFEESSVVNARGHKLYTVSYTPAEGDAVAIVLFHHGLGEHVARYKDVFSRFPAAGIAVYSYDAHGMGKSEPQEPRLRAYVNDFNDLIDDYLARYAAVKEVYTTKGKALPPVFATGHSLGGLVAAHAVARDPSLFSGLVLHSAAIDVEWNLVLRVQAALGNLLAALVPYKPLVPAVRPEDMSTDPEVVRNYIEDPLVYHGNVKARTANTTLKAFVEMQRMGSTLDVPLYVAHGTADHCTNLKAARRLYEACPNADKVFHAVEGAYHELLHGPEKDESFVRLRAWILDHARPRAAL